MDLDPFFLPLWKKTTNPSSKRLLCLFILFILILSPISFASQINPELTQEQKQDLDLILNDSQISKIHPEIADKIINQPSRIITFFTGMPKEKVLLQVDEKNFEKVSNLIKENKGIVKEKFEIGDVISAEIPVNKLKDIITEEVKEITPEFEYKAFLDDSVKSSGVNLAWDSGYSGKDVKIAILDTGIDLDHEMFKDKVLLSKSFVDEGENDLHGHGTHCAGIATGNGEYKGIAYDADLINVKVLNKYGSGKSSEIIAGINWAVENNVDIISMSFGATYTEYDSPLISAIKDAISQGVVFVVASGNCRQGCGGFFGVTTPGNIEEVISVGSVDNKNNLASFSSGDVFDDYIKPDFVTPGVDITSSWIDGYETKSGTSMSTPFLAGIIALLMEKQGDLSQSQVKEILEQSSIDLGAQGKDVEYGSGAIDISKLLSLEEIPEEEENPGENETGGSEEGNYTIQWGYDSPEEAKDAGSMNFPNDYDTNSNEEYYYTWDSGDEQWYYIETTCNGDLIFEITGMSSGVDVDMWLYDWEVVYHGVHSTNAGEEDEYMETPKYNDAPWAFYLKTIPYYVPLEGEWVTLKFTCGQADIECSTDAECSDEAYTSSGCSGDTAYTNYYRGDCTNAGTSSSYCRAVFDYSEEEDCSGISYGSYSSYYCTEDKVQRERTKYTGYCSSATCKESTSTDYDIKSENGDGSFCSDRAAYDCSLCKYGQYDCDYDSRCSTGNCAGDFWGITCLGVECGCCNSNELWNTDKNKCVECVTDGDCNTGEKCSSDKCVDKTCAGDYDKPEGSCIILGAYKRKDDSVFECRNYEGHLCWDLLSSNGDDNFCNDLTKFNQKCNNGEYDCDGSDECSSGYCKGAILGTCWGVDCGCCDSDEKWDKSLHVCYLPCIDNDGDGYGTREGQRCDKTGIDCNDNNKDINPGATEKCDNTDWDCDGYTKNGFDLNTDFYNCGSCGNVCPGVKDIDYSCQSGTCERLRTCIENGICEVSEGENPINCDKDCYGDLEILEIDAPSRVDQGQEVTFWARVKNKGTYQDSLKFEGAIVPDYWAGVIYSDMNTLSYDSITKCCPGNEYYDAVEISLNAGADEWVEFNVKAPSTLSYDHCNENGAGDNYYSTWDDSFNVLTGLYSECGEGYVYKLTENIEINRVQCNDDSDCAENEECKHKIIDGIFHSTCEAEPCENECDPDYRYLCEGSLVYECKRNNINECYKKVRIDTCNLFESCNSDTGNCGPVQIKTKLYIENSAGVDVYKQAEDYVTINLDYKGSEYIRLDYDHEAFDLLDCSNSFTITKDTSCKFKINKRGTYEFRLIGGESKTLKITRSPNIIILTNEEKLRERFNDDSGINDLLSETYNYAYKYKGIVYDLDDYILESHPFGSFNDYSEISKNTNIKNDYSIEVGKFVKEKCEACENVLILGDDYVVPHYRRDIDISIWLGLDDREDLIYSDLPYIKRSQKKFNEFEELFIKEDKYGEPTQGKDVMFIVPEDYNSEILEEITNLKNTLKNNGYATDVSIRDDNNIYCNDNSLWGQYNGKTLFIFGTDNEALKCFAFVPELEDSSFIAKNPWDAKNYAIIIQTDSKKVLQTFRNIIDNEGILELQAEWITFVESGIDAASYASMLGSGLVDWIPDAVDAGFQCIIKGDKIGCGIATVAIIIPVGCSAAGKKVIKSCLNKFDGALRRIVVNNIDDFTKLTMKLVRKGDDVNFEKFLLKFDDYFPDEVVEKTVKSIDDMEDAAKGTERYLKKASNELEEAKRLDDIPFESLGKSNFLKKYGELDGVYDLSKLDDVEFVSIGGNVPASYDPKTKKIFLDPNFKTKNSDINEFINDHLLPHELSHYEINEFILEGEDLVDWFYMDGINKDLLEDFDELATHKMTLNKLDDASQYVAKFNLEFTWPDNTYLATLAQEGDYNALLKFKAQALEFKQTRIVNQIDNLDLPTNVRKALDKTDPDSLINKYRDAADFVGKSKEEILSDNTKNILREVDNLN